MDALLGDYRTAGAQDTQTQAAITGALLAYRTGPDQDVFTTNQITSALAAYRSAADQDTATASSIAAALLSYYTIAQVDGLLAGKLGGGRHRRADPGPHGRLAVKLDGSPQQRLQRGPGHAHRGSERGRPHPDPSGEPVEHRAHLQLLFACRYRLGTASNFVVHMSEADNVYDPLYGSFVGDQGAWSTPPDPGRNFGGRQHTAEEEDTAASALLLKHEFLDGGADDVTLATLGEVLLEPTLTTLGNFLVRSNSQSSVASASFMVGGFQLEGYAMTLSAFAWNIVRTYTLTPGRRYSFGCRYRLGTASNLVMYVSAADNDYVGVTGTFLGTASPGLLGAAAKLHFGAFGGSIPGLVQQSAGTLDLYSTQIRASAFEGESVSVLAGPHGLGHAGRTSASSS